MNIGLNKLCPRCDWPPSMPSGKNFSKQHALACLARMIVIESDRSSSDLNQTLNVKIIIITLRLVQAQVRHAPYAT